MIRDGISAEGIIDIKTSLLSGSIKTGSAGLFIMFFGFLIAIIVIPFNSATTVEKISIDSQTHRIKINLYVFFALLLFTLIFLILSVFIPFPSQVAFFVASAGSGLLCLLALVALLTNIEKL